MIEHINVEFGLDGQLFNTEMAARVKGGSVSYALGIWGRGLVPQIVEKLWDEQTMTEEERWLNIGDVVEAVMQQKALQVQATNLIVPGPKIRWITVNDASWHADPGSHADTDGERWLHCLMSVVVPDNTHIERLHDWLYEHSKFPHNLIDRELQRITQVRAAAHVFGL